TVDLEIESLSASQVEAIELECNRVIRACLPVTTHLVDSEGLAALPLRKPPKVTENIRVVEIAGYDWSPCGGTHVRNVGELGLLKVKGWEKNKKNSRVEFLAGARAMTDYLSLDRITRDLCRSLSIAVADLPKYVQRSQEESSGLRKQLRVLQEQLLEIEAAKLASDGHRVGPATVVRLVFGSRTLDEVKLLAAKVAAHPGTVAVFGTRGAIPQIVLYRSVDLRLDMGGIIRQVLPLIDGKGGGSPVQAQGGGSRPEALEHALDQVVLHVANALAGS
ncbi:MAG: DHHA1 domain-containing protein, partial [Mycobacterium leprae]